MTSLSVRLGDVTLSTPLVAASGTVGSVIEFADTIDFRHYGAAVAKSVAPEAWPGRPAPRIAEVGAGMLNGIGIQNPGVAHWLDEVSPQLSTVPTQVWASVVGHDLDGFVAVAEALEASPIPVVEINLSCPNLEGSAFALDAALSASVVASVVGTTSKAVGAKLTADAGNIVDVAYRALESGADWVVVGNTVRGAAIDVESRRPVLSGTIGGYSGAPIRPINLRAVLDIRTAIPEAPIVGCGGVSKAEHAVEYLLAGATAVSIGSAHFDTPRIAGRILKELDRYCARHGVTNIEDLKGALEVWR